MVAALGLSAGTASAQSSGMILELHGGIDLPVTDIWVLDEVGPLVGGGFWYAPADQRWSFGAEADLGIQPDGNIYRVMGKVGYLIHTSRSGTFGIMLNTGAGVMKMDSDRVATGIPGVAFQNDETDIAVNLGAKFTFTVSDRTRIVVSPQIDLGLGETCGDCSSLSWVSPISAGLQIRI
jgi:hypothetical protein